MSAGDWGLLLFGSELLLLRLVHNVGGRFVAPQTSADRVQTRELCRLGLLSSDSEMLVLTDRGRRVLALTADVQDGRTAFVAKNAWLEVRRTSAEAEAKQPLRQTFGKQVAMTLAMSLNRQQMALLRGLEADSLSLVMICSEAMRCPAAVLFEHGLIEQVGDICCLTDFGKRLAIYCRRFRPEGGASIPDEDWSTLRDGGIPQ